MCRVAGGSGRRSSKCLGIGPGWDDSVSYVGDCICAGNVRFGRRNTDIPHCVIADSYCSSGTYGIGLCSGEIFLKSQNIEVGVHRAGSYGTASNAPNSFEYRNKRLGFIADYGRDGWNVGTPPFSGDYFVPGAPVEGIRGHRASLFRSVDGNR